MHGVFEREQQHNYREMNRNGDRYTLNWALEFIINIQVVFPVASANIDGVPTADACVCCVCVYHSGSKNRTTHRNKSN